MTGTGKLKHLLKESIAAKQKAVLSVLIGLAFSFSFFLYGMMHIYVSNHADLALVFSAAIQAALVAFFAAWLVISGILYALPGNSLRSRLLS